MATTSEIAGPGGAGAPGATAIWRRYLELTKPKVVALITFTAIVGTLLASPGMPPLDALIWGNLGIALASGCAAGRDTSMTGPVIKMRDTSAPQRGTKYPA